MSRDFQRLWDLDGEKTRKPSPAQPQRRSDGQGTRASFQPLCGSEAIPEQVCATAKHMTCCPKLARARALTACTLQSGCTPWRGSCLHSHQAAARDGASSLFPSHHHNPTPPVFSTFLHFPLFLLLPACCSAALLTCLGGVGFALPATPVSRSDRAG